ncbi:MAG: ribonuclease R [Lachnospiraceae bacterium]|nr:ribonuclease R [Lachnospiraceae bacterium]
MKTREERKKLILDFMNNEFYIPMREKELAVMLQVEASDRPELRTILQELLAEQKIEVSKRGKYSLLDPKKASSKDAIVGTFISHRNGFGFVEVDGRDDDLFIPPDKVGEAFHLDTVECRILPSKRGARCEAEIVRIIERGTTQIVGTYQKASKGYGFVVPDNTKLANDVYIRSENSMGAMEGHKVVVELISYGDERKNPEGKVTEILGHVNDPGVDIMSIIKGFGLTVEFPEKVMNQAARVGDSIIEADMNGREDLRDVFMVTIDGEDAKDLDDAVSLSMEGENYVLGVHIADVSNYVQENSALDHEAISRGTSVYLVDRVIPMLPHRLSNGICSLNQGEDRLALSCIMTINPAGKVIDHRIVESVINVNHRMNYTSVNKIINLKDEEERGLYPDATPMLDDMYKLSKIIRGERGKRGSIDFDMPESKIVLDESGEPLSIAPYERNDAHKLIEDFMLMANETVAEHYYWLQVPFVYRTHDNPDPEKIQRLATFINNFGFHIRSGKEEIHPKEIQKLLTQIEGTPKEAMISRMTLRSMKQAKYTVECRGHFGLAARYYCHFTSPIRRYPDLQIHRIIKDDIRGRLKGQKLAHYDKILFEISEKSSKLERRADEAEREVEKLKKAQYMRKFIGEEYEGIISGVTEYGIYVELPSTVEGFVHISKLPGDYYIYNESTMEITGSRHGGKYELGQAVKIKVDSVDMFMRTIDFSISEED